MPKDNLTSKQEKFCINVVKGMTYSDAYRDVYDIENYKDESLYVKASELMKNPKIKSKIEELRKPVQDKIKKQIEFTIDNAINELDEARLLAKDKFKTADMISATMGKAKILGIIVDKSETKLLGLKEALVKFED